VNGSLPARPMTPPRHRGFIGLLSCLVPSHVVASRLAAACLLIALLLASATCSQPAPEIRGASHVVFISLDTARPDHFGFMGSETVRTPRLDAFASESIVFDDYMTVVPTTLASHTTLMTGKYPYHHGTPRNGFLVNQKNQMLAETLREASFHTAGFAGSFALESRFGFSQGFDHYDEDFGVLVTPGGADQNQRLASQVTDAALAYLDETGVPEHLFLFAHYFDPHAPYTAPHPYDTMYDPAGWSGIPSISAVKRHPRFSAAEREEFARRLELQYASEISYTDEHVGRLLDGLAVRGILDDAIVVVTSDHGECMWEHGEEFDHGRTVYQATMHALCVVRLPGAEHAGTRVDAVVASIDVLPTVLEFLGLDAPVDIDGEALKLTRTALESQDSLVRFGEATKPGTDVETDERWYNLRKSRCVRDGRYKYIETPYVWTSELYDLASDTDEIVDLLSAEGAGRAEADPAAGPGPSRSELESLHLRLARALSTWTDLADPLPSRFDSSQRDETVERLRSLGYLQ